jgi:uncharacterized protein
MTLYAHLDRAVIAHADATLDEMANACQSLTYASVLTDDGFPVASLEYSATNGDRFASMTSSIQALSDAVARELRIGSSDYVIIASDAGHVIQLRIPGQAMVLAALFDDRETLGMSLAVARRGAARLSDLLAQI